MVASGVVGIRPRVGRAERRKLRQLLSTCFSSLSPSHLPQAKYQAQRDAAAAADEEAAAAAAEVKRLQEEADAKKKLVLAAGGSLTAGSGSGSDSMAASLKSKHGIAALVREVAASLPKLAALAKAQEQLKGGAEAAAARAALVKGLLQKAFVALGLNKPGLLAAQIQAEVAFKRVS